MWVPKNAEFDADFVLVEKVVTNSCEKSYQRKSDRKMEFSYIYYSMQKFSAYIFIMYFISVSYNPILHLS
jgi:hypothetical protein